MPPHRWNYLICTGVALVGLTLICARSSVASESVVSAVNAINVAALESLSTSAPTAPQKMLAAGALLALRHEDAKAIAMLMPITRSPGARNVRATAYLVLSDFYCRNQRYLACYSAIHVAQELSPESVNMAYRQAMAFAHAISGVKPMQLVHVTPGSLPITDAKANVIRVPVKIDGHRSGAMLDTGASFSTISASLATRFGIRMLRHGAAAGSSTRRSVGIRLGVAKQLQIGNVTLKNVVFIVVPDSDLPIPRRLRIGAIIGLPVIMTLGRLEFLDSATPALLYDVQCKQTTVHRDTHSNMLLSSLTPYVLVHVAGSRAMLRMELDTGSNSTIFTKNAMSVAPNFFAGAQHYVWHVGGVGGFVKERRALRLPEATLIIGERRVVLKNVIVSSRDSATNDGVIGANILRGSTRWIMDFKTMTFSVANQRKCGWETPRRARDSQVHVP